LPIGDKSQFFQRKIGEKEKIFRADLSHANRAVDLIFAGCSAKLKPINQN